MKLIFAVTLALSATSIHAEQIQTKVGVKATGYLGWQSEANRLKAPYQGTPVVESWLPVSYDWRGSGYLPPIRDQGSCGSCWAFGITKSLEVANYIVAGQDMVDLSEQQQVSCNRKAYGCRGGFMESAQYVVDHAIASEQDFPYRASNVACKSNLSGVVKAKGYVLLGSPQAKPTVEAIKTAILRYGSVFVTVAAGGAGWSGSGKITGCRNRSTNHIVNLVGWTADDNWVMANSWGTSWGTKGYALIPFGCDKIADEAGYIETY